MINALQLKAALMNIFMLTMNQITKCNVKGITHNDKPMENYHYLELFRVFQLIVLVLQPAHLLFWFTLTTLVGLVSRHNM